MNNQGRWIQLAVFALLALLSYGIYDRFFGQVSDIQYEPFTKGYSLEGVIMKTSDADGRIISTIESPAIVHYADTEISMITEPKYTLHQPNGDWIFQSIKGEINPDQTELYFPGKVYLMLDSQTQDKVAIDTSDLRVDVNQKTGHGQGVINVIKPGMLMTGVGSIIDLTMRISKFWKIYMQNLKIKSVLALLFFAGYSEALESDRNAKIIIQGPGCVLKAKINQTECQKGLTIEQGSMLIKSTYGLIHHHDKGVQNVLMKGNQVYMEQMMDDNTKMVIKANEIDYKKKEEKVYLKGNVHITSSLGVTTGEEIEFDLKSQEIKAIGEESTEQFRMEIDPEND